MESQSCRNPQHCQRHDPVLRAAHPTLWPADPVAAGIAPVSPGSPLPPPTPATNVTATLLSSGEIRLDWAGTTANGTFYAVSRRLGEGQPFALIGSVSARSFVDTTIPAATAEATYTLRTHRDTESSDESEPITVRFGVAGASSPTTGGENDGGLSLAA